jgi:hypothetical protein
MYFHPKQVSPRRPRALSFHSCNLTCDKLLAIVTSGISYPSAKHYSRPFAKYQSTQQGESDQCGTECRGRGKSSQERFSKT